MNVQSASRRRPSAALVVSLVALFVALSDSGNAARIVNVVLGKTNTATRPTGISAPTRRPVLAVTNTGRGAAGSFTVKNNAPPFIVNSTTRVKKLNADLLDGLDSTSFWNIDGNAGTNPASNFIGTTDAQPLVVRTNGNEVLRVDTSGQVGIGTTTPQATMNAIATGGALAVLGNADTGRGVDGVASSGIGVIGDSATGRGVVGTLGGGSCAGTYAVGGCAAAAGIGVYGTSASFGVNGVSPGGIGVFGNSTSGRAVVGTLGPGSCAGTYGVGGCGGATGVGVQGTSGSGIGILGDSSTRGIVGTLNETACNGTTFAVGGCGGGAGAGVYGDSSARGIIGTLGASACPGVYAVGACGATIGDGLLAVINHPAGGSTAAAVHANNTGGGDIFLGQSGASRVARIDGSGKAYFDGGTQSSGADYADSLRADSAAKLRTGDVLAIDPTKGGTVELAHGAQSTLVAGVYSTKPAMLGVGSYHLGGSLRGRVPVALVGVVPTHVSAENGPVQVGDLLTMSRTPGYAMKAKPVLVNGVPVYPAGTIIGKAMQQLGSGKGLIKVLVTLR